MPAAIQFAPQAPVQKAVPKPATAAAPATGHDAFDRLLNGARKPAPADADAAKTSRASLKKAAKSAACKATKAKSARARDDADDAVDEAAAEAAAESATPADRAAPADASTDAESTEADDADGAAAKDAADPKATDSAPANPLAAAAAAASAASPPVKPVVSDDAKRSDGDDDAEGEQRADGDADPDALAAVSATGPAATAAAAQANQNGGSDDSPDQSENAAPDPTKLAQRKAAAAAKPTVAPIGGDADAAPKLTPRKPAPLPAEPSADAPLDAAALAAQLLDLDRASAPQPTKADGDLAPPAPDIAAPRGPQPNAAAAVAKLPDLPPAPPEAQFAADNHDNIVTGVRGQLMPHGGSMQIRLDPPELGALKVMVEMRDGVLNATFQTSNENATQLLSHSLNQLKHALEGQGVNVERLQVQQAPKSEHSPTGEDGQQKQQHDDADQHAAQQEQQRKELLKRMWRRLSGGSDPVDFMA